MTAHRDDFGSAECPHGVPSIRSDDECLDCRADEMMPGYPVSTMKMAVNRRAEMIEAHIQTLDEIFKTEFKGLNHAEQGQLDNLIMDIERISLLYSTDPKVRRLAIVTAYRALLVRERREG